MQNLTVALVQAEQVWENKIANFENYDRLLENISSDLVLLPEMFSTGFTMNTNLAEEMDRSESLNWLKNKAKHLNSAIYTSLIIQEESSFYNRGIFVFPNGELIHYDKRKTFGLAGENNHYQQGNKEVIVNYKGWKLQLQICYDLRFPEIVRNAMIDEKANYDAILYVANWPEKRSAHWKSLLVARAIENQSYVLGVNRVGEDENGLTYTGDSTIINPLGEIDQSVAYSETIIRSTLDANLLKDTRVKLPFLKDRLV